MGGTALVPPRTPQRCLLKDPQALRSTISKSIFNQTPSVYREGTNLRSKHGIRSAQSPTAGLEWAPVLPSGPATPPL